MHFTALKMLKLCTNYNNTSCGWTVGHLFTFLRPIISNEQRLWGRKVFLQSAAQSGNSFQKRQRRSFLHLGNVFMCHPIGAGQVSRTTFHQIEAPPKKHKEPTKDFTTLFFVAILPCAMSSLQASITYIIFYLWDIFVAFLEPCFYAHFENDNRTENISISNQTCLSFIEWKLWRRL